MRPLLTFAALHAGGVARADPGPTYDPRGPRNGGKKVDLWAVTPDQTETGNGAREKRQR